MSASNVSLSDSGEVDDRALVAEFKRTRCPRSFEVLFDRHGRHLFRVACRLYRSVDLAEDCVQETFRRAIQQIEGFDEVDRESSFWAWLVTIAKDICLSEWRRKQTRIKYAEEAASARTSTVPITQYQQVMIAEIRSTIRTLTTECRICYLLFFVEGYTYKEVSQITGYTHEQVKTFIQTARRHLDRKFRPAGSSI